MEKKTVEELVENGLEAADVFYDKITDRVLEKMKQKENNIFTDIEVSKKAVGKIAEVISVINGALSDHIVAKVNGEKITSENKKINALQVIDKMLGIADEYYDMITDRVIEKMNQAEENAEEDLQVAKKISEELVEKADKHFDTITTEIAKSLSSK